jgi:uncharacterized membrane-anchored protein YhcB (DUF1043 family)
MEQLNLISLLIGLAIGVILVLLNRMNAAKRTEELRNQLNESLTMQKMGEEKSRKSESDLQLITSKYDQKLQEFQGLISENASMLSSLQNAKEQLQKMITDFADLKNQNQISLQDVADKNQKVSELQSQNRYLLERLTHKKRILKI